MKITISHKYENLKNKEMKNSILYFTLLVFSLYSCHTDYKSKIDKALQNEY